MSNIFEELTKRGYTEQLTHPEEIKNLLDNDSISFYIGFDPTADSLHVGHFISLMVASHMQKAGHKPIILIGGGTATIGDPSGKTDMRRMMSREEIDHNVECFKKQIAKFLSFEGKNGAIIVNNADWLLGLNFINFSREIGSLFSVNKMLSAASDEVLDNLYALSDSPVLLGELLALLRYRYEQIDFIDEPVDLGFDCPLDLHCTYTRDQLLVALDFLKPATVREGVKWLPEKQLDVFFVTLNKADKDYSPTTMYNDYSINESLFHWQSQSTTAADSPTGQRCIHHRERGSKVLLFVREFKADRITGGAAAYTFLGAADYVKHEGSRPMNITWKLERPIPAKFLKKTNKLVVG